MQKQDINLQRIHLSILCKITTSTSLNPLPLFLPQSIEVSDCIIIILTTTFHFNYSPSPLPPYKIKPVYIYNNHECICMIKLWHIFSYVKNNVMDLYKLFLIQKQKKIKCLTSFTYDKIFSLTLKPFDLHIMDILFSKFQVLFSHSLSFLY